MLSISAKILIVKNIKYKVIEKEQTWIDNFYLSEFIGESQRALPILFT